MMNAIKDLLSTLTEEVKYYDNAVSYSKSLEATLWGLEQQAQYPENSSKEDQGDLSEEINKARVKLISLQQLLSDQENKIYSTIKNFSKLDKSCVSCKE